MHALPFYFTSFRGDLVPLLHICTDPVDRFWAFQELRLLVVLLRDGTLQSTIIANIDELGVIGIDKTLCLNVLCEHRADVCG